LISADYDIELAYKVQLPLIMSMCSVIKGKVAYHDADTQSIHMA
jgi:hypothetical protein